MDNFIKQLESSQKITKEQYEQQIGDITEEKFNEIMQKTQEDLEEMINDYKENKEIEIRKCITNLLQKNITFGKGGYGKKSRKRRKINKTRKINKKYK